MTTFVNRFCSSRGKKRLEKSPAIVALRDYAAMLRVESTLGRKSARVFLLERD
jgi:hypothetical protein